MKGNPKVDAAVLILRVGLGLILMYFGAQKLLGVFGGPGPQGTIEMFRKGMGIPAPLTVLAMCGEFFGGLGMIVGLLTPVAAFGATCTMGVATYINWKTPGIMTDLMNGKFEAAPTAFFAFSLMVGSLAVMLIGGGSYSLDAKLFQRRGRR